MSFHKITTFRREAPINQLLYVRNSRELGKGGEYAYKKGLPVLLLGDGSNVLPTKIGFNGLVVIYKTPKCTFEPLSDNIVRIPGGQSLRATTLSLARCGMDLTTFSGIPGTIGAAVHNNSGRTALGRNIGECVKEVSTLDIRTGKTHSMTNEELVFRNRSTVLKEPNNGTVITSVTLELPRMSSKKTMNFYKTVFRERYKKNREGVFTAGSAWINDTLSRVCNFGEETIEGGSIQTRDLIKKLGLDKIDINGAHLTRKYCFLRLEPDSSGKNTRTSDDDIRALMNLVGGRLKDEFGVDPVLEIEIIGPNGMISSEDFLSKNY